MITMVTIIIAVVTISISVSVILPRFTMVIVFWHAAIAWPPNSQFRPRHLHVTTNFILQK